jgi:hypothetical protein
MCTSIDEVERRAMFEREFRCLVAVTALLIGSVLLIPRSSYAFDGQRKGFMIGLGLGGGYCFGGQPDLPWRSNVDPNQPGFVVEGKIGFSGSRLSVFMDYRGGDFSGINMNVTGVGATYYLSDHAPGLYLTGVIGASKWRWNGSDTGGWWSWEDMSFQWAEASGFGVCVGAGWEVWRHWAIESSVIWGHPTGTYEDSYANKRGEIDATLTALLLTINYVAY